MSQTFIGALPLSPHQDSPLNPLKPPAAFFMSLLQKKRHLAARLNSISQLNTVAATFPETNPTTYTCTEDLVAKPSVTNS